MVLERNREREGERVCVCVCSWHVSSSGIMGERSQWIPLYVWLAWHIEMKPMVEIRMLAVNIYVLVCSSLEGSGASLNDLPSFLAKVLPHGAVMGITLIELNPFNGLLQSTVWLMVKIKSLLVREKRLEMDRYGISPQEFHWLRYLLWGCVTFVPLEVAYRCVLQPTARGRRCGLPCVAERLQS